MDRSVVGILIKSKPLLNVLAIKPPISVITPPPRLIIRVILSASISVKLYQTSLHVSRFLFFSPDLIFNTLGFIDVLLLKYSRQYLSVFSSTITNNFEYDFLLNKLFR